MEPRPPKISVIIPAYQHAREIPLCLDSIFRQTFTDFEVIVVNDGSTDRTLEALAPYRDRITVVTQENRGAPAARNRGFTLSRGPYVLFCDADVVMRPEYLATMLATLERHPEASYAYSSFRYGLKKFRSWPFDADRLRTMNYIMTSSVIRREHFPGFDESIRRFQDWDLWLTMLEQGRIGVWIPEILFTVIPHKEGISRWLPRFAYRFPWKKFGIRIRAVDAFVAAERIIKEKHHLA